MEARFKKKIPPLVMGALIIALDQITKAVIVSVSKGRTGIIAKYLGDFFYLAHQRNRGAAFSLLDDLPEGWRLPVLGLIPLVALVCLLVYYFRSKDLSRFQEWTVMAVFSGGIGNLIDRILRPSGVVDFLSFKFYGIFGLERWPTFNVADSSVVAGGILLAVSFLIDIISKRDSKEAAR
jgi:signal peptidase II